MMCKAALVDVKAAMKKINEGALSDQVIGDFRKHGAPQKHHDAVDEKVLGEENAANLKDAIRSIKDAAESFKRSSRQYGNQPPRSSAPCWTSSTPPSPKLTPS
jgi:phospholipid/cholesterol/gamma-HCH transport system substrate-binding protein